jgi:predicted lipoprotein with Yx(FWY)xxD motif
MTNPLTSRSNPPTSRKVSLALKIGLPLAAFAVLAAACSNGSSGSSGAASTPASTPASPASPASSAAGAASGSSAAGASSTSSTVDVHTNNGTSVLTDSTGRALYLFGSDTSTKSTCSGACATAWPPLTAKGAPTAGPGAKAADLATITRPGGTKQVTYAGHPLYYFAGDNAPGQTNGEASTAFGAPWYLLTPSGQQITSLTPTPAQSSTPPTPSSGSNAGGGWS